MRLLNTLLDTLKCYVLWMRAIFPGRTSKKKADHRHLLLLAWHFPPSISSGTHRPVSFANYGVSHDWRISVVAGDDHLCSTNPGESLLGELDSRIKVDRLMPSNLQPSWRFLPKLDGGFINALVTVNYVKSKYRDNIPAVIMASGPPFHNFVAAMMLARHFEVPLVLDYRDEWTENPFAHTVDHKDVGRLWESRCLSAADIAIFTTRSQCFHIKRCFLGILEEKVYYLPNGWVHGNSSRLQSIRTSENSRFVICYTGVIGDHTPVLEFLDTLQLVFRLNPDLATRIKIELIGQKPAQISQKILQHPMSGAVDCIDHLPQTEAIQKMHDSDALLLMTTDQMSRYRPGKLYQYVLSGKPIICFGCEGEVTSVIEGLKIGHRVAMDDAGTLAVVIEGLLASSCTGELSGATTDWLKKHSRMSLAHDLFEILEAIETGVVPLPPEIPMP